MSDQPQLFYDSFEDAVRHVVSILGGPKEAGHLLWPTKSPDAARTRILDCLNPKEPDKLSPDEIVSLCRAGREKGCHAIIEWITAEAGYTRPTPIAPQDEAAELQRQFIEAVKLQRQIADRMERNGSIRAVA